MKTIGLDTSTLLDFRLKRKVRLAEIKNLLQKCLDGKVKIYVPLPVLLETEWVLRSFYKHDKSKIVYFLNELLLIPILTTNKKEEFKFALNLYSQSSQVGFTDCLIAVQTHNQKCDGFLTSDKHLRDLYNSL